MSIYVPNTFPKEEFENKILKKFNCEELQGYKVLFLKNYKCLKNATEYTLNPSASLETKTTLDYLLKRIGYNKFDTLVDIAEYFRRHLEEKKSIILFAYNGTGKTRLSCEFKSLGQETNEETGVKTADTLYYNAFTEDLFSWDNDLANDTQRVLKINSESKFFSGLKELEMESKIRPILQRYADFDFTIDYDNWSVSFSRNITVGESTQTQSNIKISRGEENIFVWCFFLAIFQLVVDKQESYDWVKYIYIDDPISSLDDNNAIAVASHLAQLITNSENVKVVVSSHHTLFFNVLCNELDADNLFLKRESEHYSVKDTRKTPFFHHIALLRELKKAADTGNLYTYHFNILRNILEKTASFHGYAHFSSCIKNNEGDQNGIDYTRIINLLSHGNYSLFDPKEMVEENKEHFRNALNLFLQNYKFNDKLFEDNQDKEEQS